MKRKELPNAVNRQLREAQRSKSLRNLASILRTVLDEIQKIEEEEINTLNTTVATLLKVGKPIEINQLVFEQALIYQTNLSLSLQDAIMYAAIIIDLKQHNPQEIKCFLSQDSDFVDELDQDEKFSRSSVKTELASYNCRYIPKFEDGLSFIQSEISKPNQ